MEKIIVEKGVLHIVPKDIKEALLANKELLEKWNKLTPIARNEWICWTTIVKQPETREHHIKRLCTEISEGEEKALLLARLSS